MATDLDSMWAAICLLATRPVDAHWETIKWAVGIAVAGLVALGVAFVTHSLPKRREKQRAALDALKARRDLTISLWNIWTSDSLFAMRQGLMDVISDDSHGSPPLAISYRRIRALGQKRALHSIQHFFVDLSEIKNCELLDLALFDALFHEVIRRWKPAFAGGPAAAIGRPEHCSVPIGNLKEKIAGATERSEPLPGRATERRCGPKISIRASHASYGSRGVTTFRYTPGCQWPATGAPDADDPELEPPTALFCAAIFASAA